MERLDRTAARAVRSLLDRQPATAAKVQFAWTLAAGQAVANATTLRWSDDGLLRVEAKTDAWRAEIIRARPLVATRLNDLLGPDVVRKIVVA